MDQPITLTSQLIEQITQWVAWDIRPGSVLHVGCGQGALVRSLREAGVPAWGIDAPERLGAPGAGVQAAGEAPAWCQAGDYTRPFDRPYDLVICLDVARQLPLAQADRLIQNICAHARAVLFSALPSAELVPGQSLSPGAWAARFAQHDLYRCLDEGELEAGAWVMLFRKQDASLPGLIEAYEDLLWQARQESTARRGVEVGLCADLTRREYDAQARADVRVREVWGKVEESEAQRLKVHQVLDELLASDTYRLMARVGVIRRRLIPLGSRREQWMDATLQNWAIFKRNGLKKTLKTSFERLVWKARITYYRRHLDPAQQGQPVTIEAVGEKPPLRSHQATVDIVVCVHNALADVQNCLTSVQEHSSQPYSLILVDDGSQAETCEYLAAYAGQHGCRLIRNDQARGYTFAANQGLRASTGDFVILLNSDTIVTAGWLERMVACAEADPQNGIVGPLSNTASWQSIPELSFGGDWADNLLPPDISIQQFGELVSRYAAGMYLQMKLLNGFCIMFRRGVIDEVGYFDEETFGAG